MFTVRYLICLILLSPFPLSAQTLTVALGDQDYPPFYFVDENTGELRGISVDVCNALAKQLGYELEYRRFPFVRLLNNLETGSVDMACTLFNTYDRAPGAIYVSVPHAMEEIQLIRLRDRPERAAGTSTDEPVYEATDEAGNNSENAEKLKLAGVRGYYYGPGALPELTLYNEDTQLPLSLINHRVDAVLSNLPTFRYFARLQGLDDDAWETSDSPWFSGPVYIAFSRSTLDSHQLASEFTAALVHLRSSPEYQALLQSYGLNAPPF